jgi:hypothetical protein
MTSIIVNVIVRFGEKMMKKFSIVVFVLLLSIAFVSAAVPIVKYNAVNDIITDNDNTAQYKFALSNTEPKEDRFQFYTINAFWDINPTIVVVPAGSTSIFDMDITLNSRDISGPQLVPVTIKSLNSEDSIVEELYVYIRQSNSAVPSYVLNVKINDVKMVSEIDPREPLSVEIDMQNRNPLDIKDLRIVVDSKLFSKEVQTSLGPLEGKTNQILLDLNKLQEPGIYTVNVYLMASNKTITNVQKEVKVMPYSDVSVEQTKIRRLFSYTESLKLHNDGNYETVKQIKVQKNFFAGMFTKSSLADSSIEKTKLREDGVTYLVWEIPLKPQESQNLVVTTSYNSIAILIILIIAGIIMYYIFRSPILLYKRAKIIVSTDDGLTEIKVKLHLKNRSGKEIRNVKVIDRHPKIVSLVEDNSIGAMKPTKLLSADKVHSLLMWNLEALEPYEERLLSYTIRSQLNIVGNVHLHSAKVRFMGPSGERTTGSNDVTLLHRSVNTIEYK